jgi:(p)ppGpp synthase/HD superfamily hydrolase
MSTNLFLDPVVLYALEFAASAHNGQLRKGEDRVVPYVSHAAAVGLTLAQSGFSTNTVVAGVLHDVVEDTAVTEKDINTEFGSEVAFLVKNVTEDASLPFLERKKAYCNNIKLASSEIKAISAADKIANTRSCLIAHARGESVKSVVMSGGPEVQLTLANDRVFAISHNFAHPIVEELKVVVEEYKQLLKLYK